jgi:hypothetical protein
MVALAEPWRLKSEIRNPKSAIGSYRGTPITGRVKGVPAGRPAAKADFRGPSSEGNPKAETRRTARPARPFPWCPSWPWPRPFGAARAGTDTHSHRVGPQGADRAGYRWRVVRPNAP